MLLLLLACSGSEPSADLRPVTNEEATESLVHELCRAATEGAIPCEPTPTRAVIGGHDVDLSVEVTHFTVLPGRTIGMGASAEKIPGEVQLGGMLTLSVDGRELIRTELSEAGSDVDPTLAREAAVRDLSQRFVVGYGLGVLDALVGAPEARAARGVGLQAPMVQHGPRGVWTSHPMMAAQGVNPDSVRDQGAVARSLMAAIGPFLDEIEGEGLHSVEVRARLGGGGANGRCPILPQIMVPGATVSAVPFEGVVHIDQGPSGDICTLGTTVNWPLPPQGATLEWTQVMIVGAAPGAAPAPAE